MYSWQEILFRLFLASVFGALIGLEREQKDRAAGLRTHMMVSLGSALIMMVSSFGFSDILGSDHVVLDPSRVAAQVISGIGFIGAGTILFMNQQGRIRGLTTAAGLWTVAAIGLATGGGMYFAAGATTVLALIILWMLRPLEKRFSQKFRQKTLNIEADKNADIKYILDQIEETKGVNYISYSADKTGPSLSIQLKFESFDPKKIGELMNSLQQKPEIHKIFLSTL
ncbi:MAG: MgtC/SapB family protein [Ginsengibacter sp.]